MTKKDQRDKLLIGAGTLLGGFVVEVNALLPPCRMVIAAHEPGHAELYLIHDCENSVQKVADWELDSLDLDKLTEDLRYFHIAVIEALRMKAAEQELMGDAGKEMTVH